MQPQTQSPNPPGQSPALHPNGADPILAQASKLEHDMLVAAQALAQFGLLDPERVAALARGTGHVDLATNLVELSSLFWENWDAVKQHTSVCEANIMQAAALGLTLHERLARQSIDLPVPLNLRCEDADADAIAPTIYGRRGRSGDGESGAPAHAPEVGWMEAAH